MASAPRPETPVHPIMAAAAAATAAAATAAAAARDLREDYCPVPVLPHNARVVTTTTTIMLSKNEE